MFGSSLKLCTLCSNNVASSIFVFALEVSLNSDDGESAKLIKSWTYCSVSAQPNGCPRCPSSFYISLIIQGKSIPMKKCWTRVIGGCKKKWKHLLWNGCWWQVIKNDSTNFSLLVNSVCCHLEVRCPPCVRVVTACDVYPQDNALGQTHRAGDWQGLPAHHWSSAVERGECVALFL